MIVEDSFSGKKAFLPCSVSLIDDCLASAGTVARTTSPARLELFQKPAEIACIEAEVASAYGQAVAVRQFVKRARSVNEKALVSRLSSSRPIWRV